MFRDGSKWFARPVMEDKDESWKQAILSNVTEVGYTLPDLLSPSCTAFGKLIPLTFPGDVKKSWDRIQKEIPPPFVLLIHLTCLVHC